MKQLLRACWIVVVVALPVAAALSIAYGLSRHDQEARAQTLARVVLDRAARTTEQLADAFDKLKSKGFPDPCSEEGLTLMRELGLGSSLLQGLGYVAGTKLRCSSVGSEVVDLGPPDYLTATGQAIRRRTNLTFAAQTPLLIVTGPSGFTGFIHPSLIFDMTDGGDAMPSGIVNYSKRTVLLTSHESPIDWKSVRMPPAQMSGIVFAGDQLVAWIRSEKWDQFSYASIPASNITDEFWVLSRGLVPLGIAGSLLGLWLLRRLTDSRWSLPALLRMGLRRNEIVPVYQPIADMRTGDWVGAEVLARWRRRSGEWVSPDVFIRLAEKHGLIVQLTRVVATRALEEFAPLLLKNDGLFLSLNVSSADLKAPGFPAFLDGCCQRHKVPASAIHLEITERQEVSEGLDAEVISGLRQKGFKVGTDDFGVGYSNLAYLDNFELDYIKIDRVFISNALREGTVGGMIDHIIAVGRSRNLEVIAEGIERPEQRDYLLARGVFLGQGWLFSKALSAAEFSARPTSRRSIDKRQAA